MSLDSTILKLLKHRDKYDLYRAAVPLDILAPHTKIILGDYGEFFKESAATSANVDAFLPWFLLKHPKLKEEPKALLTGIIKAAAADVPADVERGILNRLEDARQAAALTAVLEKYNAGEEVSVIRTVQQLAESVPIDRAELPKVRGTIEQAMYESEQDWGFHWRLDCLNQSMRPLMPGDFMIAAARVDQGKTTWYASEVSYMASQVDKLFPGQDRPIVILNNESLGIRVKTRVVQATLGMSMEEMVKHRQAGHDVYAEAMKMWGGRNLLEVYDVHDRPLSFLENIIRRRNPALVVVDMLDNVQFDGVVGNGGQRTDQILEAAYQRARIWGVKYDCAVIAMSQLSATAAGVLYPGLHELANSRTGKAGAADAVLMIGHSDDPLLRNSRWISLPKNKLQRQGGAKDPRTEVPFDGLRARFNNPSEVA